MQKWHDNISCYEALQKGKCKSTKREPFGANPNRLMFSKKWLGYIKIFWSLSIPPESLNKTKKTASFFSYIWDI